MTLDRPEPLWSDASLEYQRRFGQSHAKLFPFLGKRIWTPHGPALLLCAYAYQCEVLPDGAEKTLWVKTKDVLPLLGTEP